MLQRWMLLLILAETPLQWSASAQQSCADGMRVEGTITDPSGAVIPGAQVQAGSGELTYREIADRLAYVVRLILTGAGETNQPSSPETGTPR